MLHFFTLFLAMIGLNPEGQPPALTDGDGGSGFDPDGKPRG